MLREQTLKDGFYVKLKTLMKDNPNDMDLGKKVRKLVNDIEEKLNELTENKKGG